ncbi:MAG: histidine kinase dimerization/phospho-acceptor domain-containing protein [Nodosilinea sp.]
MLPPELLSSPPSFTLTSDLVSVAQWLTQTPDWGGEYIIIVDDQKAPLGAIALAPLWAFYHQHQLRPLKSPTTANLPRLMDCQPWLQPVVLIPASSSVTDLGKILTNNPRGPWVLIDGDGRYQGAIRVAGLLTWDGATRAFADRSDRNSVPTLASRLPESASAQAHNWLMLLNHSIKTPLTSLLGLSTLLLDPRIGSLGDRQSRYVHLMRRAIRQLIRLINQWVDWMGLEADQFTLTMDRVDLPALANSWLSQFHSSWLADQGPPPAWMAEFTCHLSSTLPPLNIDRRCLQQSLYGVLDYLLQERSQPQALTIESWGNWLGFTLSGSYPTTERPDLPRGNGPIPAMGPLDSLPLALARRLCQRQGGELVGFCSSRYGYRFTLLLPPLPSPATPVTTLVVLISRAGEVIDQVYALLQSSSYQLAVVGGSQDEMAAIQRLSPTVVLYHGESLDPCDRLIANDLPWPGPESPALIWIGCTPGDFVSESAATIATPHLEQRLIPALDSLRQSSQASLPATKDRRVLLLLRLQVNLPPQLEPWQQALQRHNCRLLRAEDLTQASLLCRIWQPDGILLDQSLSTADWQRLIALPEIRHSPLISLSSTVDQPPAPLSVTDLSEVMTQSPEEIATTLLQRIPSQTRKPN